ncbi:MAG: DUF4214 domain-containing protein [Opitutaceae bacterium]|nr:DUF4214 domain-containing protein [Opitutaceae bacterium]
MHIVAPQLPASLSRHLRFRALAWLAMLGIGLAGLIVPVRAQPMPAEDPLLDERTIIAVFEDMLGREPTRREVREWRSRSEGMTVEELEDEIRHTREFRNLTPEKVITDAFRDLLERDPDPDGMRHYRRRMIERGWTAGDVRDAIRSSDEYRTKRADDIIDRAFDDLLERAPTAAERDEYRRRLLKDGTEDGIRRNIKKTEEYKYTIPRQKITKAYQEILGRDPDPEGLENYRKRMINDGWSIDRVRDALLKSPEYRKKYPRK